MTHELVYARLRPVTCLRKRETLLQLSCVPLKLG